MSTETLINKVGRPRYPDHIRTEKIKESQKKYRQTSDNYREYQRLYRLNKHKKELIEKMNVDPESQLYTDIMNAESADWLRLVVYKSYK